MSAPERIFGLPGAENLHASIEEATAEVLTWADPDGPDEITVTVEEWTVHPPAKHLPDIEGVLDLIASQCEDSAVNETDEGWWENLLRSMKRPEVHACARALIDAIGAGITYRMADQEVATHQVTLAVPKPPAPCCWNCAPLADATGKPRVQPECPECGDRRCPRATDHRNACEPLNAYEDTDGDQGEDAVRERQYERDHGIGS